MTRTLLLVYRPRQDDTCPVARRLSRGPMRVRKGGLLHTLCKHPCPCKRLGPTRSAYQRQFPRLRGGTS